MASSCPSPRRPSPGPLHHLQTSPHLLIKITVCFQGCSTSLQAPEGLGPPKFILIASGLVFKNLRCETGANLTTGPGTENHRSAPTFTKQRHQGVLFSTL